MPLYIALLFNDDRLVFKRPRSRLDCYEFLEPSQLHLTLLYIGDYTGAYAKKIVNSISRYDYLAPSQLLITGLGMLPPGKNTNIVVFVRDERGLLDMARRKMLRILRGDRVSVQDRYLEEYKPHITIAKRRKECSKTLSYKQLKTLEAMLPRRVFPLRLVAVEIAGDRAEYYELKARWV